MTNATNDQSIYRVPNDQSDGSVFDLPDTDGSGETDPDGDSLENNGGEGYDIRGEDYAGIKVINGFNENVDVTLRGTTFDDDGMAEDAEDTSATTINAGETAYLPFSERWAYVRVNVDPAADPANGTLKGVFQSDRNGKA
jgi:hypothetical protein